MTLARTPIIGVCTHRGHLFEDCQCPERERRRQRWLSERKQGRGKRNRCKGRRDVAR